MGSIYNLVMGGPSEELPGWQIDNPWWEYKETEAFIEESSCPWDAKWKSDLRSRLDMGYSYSSPIEYETNTNTGTTGAWANWSLLPDLAGPLTAHLAMCIAVIIHDAPIAVKPRQCFPTSLYSQPLSSRAGRLFMPPHCWSGCLCREVGNNWPGFPLQLAHHEWWQPHVLWGNCKWTSWFWAEGLISPGTCGANVHIRLPWETNTNDPCQKQICGRCSNHLPD